MIGVMAGPTWGHVQLGKLTRSGSEAEAGMTCVVGLKDRLGV